MTTTDEQAPPRVDVDAEVAAEIKRLRDSGQLELLPVRQCWICQDEGTRRVVNNLLSRGLTLQDIADILDESINRVRLARGDRPITVRRIRTHARKHFDLEHPSWAVYRRIAEKRAAEVGKDYEMGVGGYVTHLALLETVVHKGYENLVSPSTIVGVGEAVKASKALVDFERRNADQQEHAAMLAEMNQIMIAVKETVPPEYWETILNKLGQGGAAMAPVPQRAITVVDAEEFDPGEDEDFDHDEDVEH